MAEGLAERGIFFDEETHVTLPIQPRNAWTLKAWFIWSDGSGPLIAASDDAEQWGWISDDKGFCTYRLGGVERRTQILVETLHDKWIFVAVTKLNEGAALWINGASVDTWDSAPTDAVLSDAVVMKDAVGFAADVAYFDFRFPEARLLAVWNAGKGKHRV